MRADSTPAPGEHRLARDPFGRLAVSEFQRRAGERLHYARLLGADLGKVAELRRLEAAQQLALLFGQAQAEAWQSFAGELRARRCTPPAELARFDDDGGCCPVAPMSVDGFTRNTLRRIGAAVGLTYEQLVAEFPRRVEARPLFVTEGCDVGAGRLEYDIPGWDAGKGGGA